MYGLDTAAGISGLLSLTITVCGSLVKYYQDWSSYSEVNDALARLKLLDTTLNALQAVASTLETKSFDGADHVQKLLLSVESGRKKLESILEKCLASPSSKAPKKLKQGIKHAVYPFEKSAITDLERVVDHLIGDLELGINTLQLDISIKQLGNSETISANVSDMSESLTRAQVKVDHIDITTKNTESKVLAMYHRLDDHHVRNERNSEIANEMLSKILEHLNSLDASLTAPNVASQLMRQPAAHRLVCDAVTAADPGVPSQVMPTQPRSDTFGCNPIMLQRFCRCRQIERTETSIYISWPVRVYRQDRLCSKHSEHCPYHLYSNRIRRYGFHASLAPFLAKTVGLAFTAYTGAGGRSLGVPLRPKSFPRGDSPTFEALGKLVYGIIMETKVENAFNEILCAFRVGEATPYDVNSMGDTILVYLGHLMRLSGKWEADKEVTFFIHRFIIATIDANVPLNEPNIYGEVFLNFLISRFRIKARDPLRGSSWLSRWHNVVEHAISCGADLDLCMRSPEFGLDIMRSFRTMSEIVLDAGEVGPLSREILKKSEYGLAKILHESLDKGITSRLFEERTFLGQNLLHFASHWPRGIELLIKYGAKSLVGAADDCGLLPVYYAAACDEPQAMALLLRCDESSSWNGRFSDYHWAWQYSPGCCCESLLYFTVQNAGLEAVSIVVDSVARKRQELGEFARACLPPTTWTELGIDVTDCILDGDLLAALQFALADAGIPIPHHLALNHTRGTVYHNRNLTSEAADVLWAHGFLDVDSPSFDNTSPLFHAATNNMDMILWLENKGAHLRCSAGVVDGTTLWHVAAADFPWERLLEAWRNPSSLVLQRIIGSTSADTCTCACTTGGCTPLVCLWRMLSTYGNRVAQKVIQSIEAYGQLSLPQAISSIRLATFHVLGLTHICCRWNRPTSTETEAWQIRDEERSLSEQLETLMEEFEQQYVPFAPRLGDFLDQHWAPRMIKHREATPVASSDDLARIEELGVKLAQVPDVDVANRSEFYKKLKFWVGSVCEEPESAADSSSAVCA